MTAAQDSVEIGNQPARVAPVGGLARRSASRVALVLALLLPASAFANTGHWRSIRVASVSSNVGACSPAIGAWAQHQDGLESTFSNCDAPADPVLEFRVADGPEIRDATLSFRGRALSGSVAPRVTCVSPAGTEVAQIMVGTSFTTSARRLDWDVPASCFAAGDARIQIEATNLGNLVGDFVALNVKSKFRNAALTEVVAPDGTCGPECAAPMTVDNQVYSPFVACSATDGFANPTDFSFDTFDHASVTAANLILDANASSFDARARVSCVSAGGSELAEIVPDRLFASSGEVLAWSVPTACFASSKTKIRVTRTGADCLAVDQIRLEVDSDARSHPITRTNQTGTCASSNLTVGCVADLNVDDNRNLNYLACSAAYAYGTPTIFDFHTPDWQNVVAGSFVLDTAASGTDANVSIACVDAAGATLASIDPGALYPMTQSIFAFEVPGACFTSANTRIALTRTGGNCLGTDFVRLHTVSGAGVADDYIVNLNSIEGYVQDVSVAPGDFLDLRVHSPVGAFSVDLIRYGETEETLHTESDLPGGPQPYHADAHDVGAGFASSWTFQIPPIFSSGLYGARIYDSSGAESTIAFIVRDVSPSDAPSIAVLGSSNTWAAYNGWSGDSRSSKSAYRYVPRDASNRTLSFRLSKRRPSPAASPVSAFAGSHLAAAERWVLEWLERENWSYSMLAGSDLEDTSILQNFSTLIVSTHSEYWSPNMMSGLEDFLDAGGNLLYLSGNGLYWRTTATDDQIEIQKYGGTHAHDGATGGLWRSVGQPEHELIGVGYTGTGYCTLINGVRYSYPYEIFESNHWLFDNLDVQDGDRVGTNGHPGNCGIGASGWETDKTNAALGTPSNSVLLGRGTNPPEATSANPSLYGGADMLYYERPSGARIFSAGSINFGRSLVLDDVLSGMMNNALERMATTPLPVAAIAAPDGTCVNGGPGCLSDVQAVDGARLRWAACSGAYEYGTPTDFHFDLPNALVDRARFHLTSDASGSDARMEISCVDPDGIRLATLSTEESFALTNEEYSWSLDPACIDSGQVTIRFDRLGSNCIGPDYAALNVVYAAPVPEPGFPLGLAAGLASLLGYRARRS